MDFVIKFTRNRLYKNGIKTIDEAKKESEEYSAKQQKDKEKKNSKNQFTNFSNQRKYDYSSLEKMMFKKSLPNHWKF